MITEVEQNSGSEEGVQALDKESQSPLAGGRGEKRKVPEGEGGSPNLRDSPKRAKIGLESTSRPGMDPTFFGDLHDFPLKFYQGFRLKADEHRYEGMGMESLLTFIGQQMGQVGASFSRILDEHQLVARYCEDLRASLSLREAEVAQAKEEANRREGEAAKAKEEAKEKATQLRGWLQNYRSLDVERRNALHGRQRAEEELAEARTETEGSKKVVAELEQRLQESEAKARESAELAEENLRKLKAKEAALEDKATELEQRLQESEAKARESAELAEENLRKLEAKEAALEDKAAEAESQTEQIRSLTSKMQEMVESWSATETAQAHQRHSEITLQSVPPEIRQQIVAEFKQSEEFAQDLDQKIADEFTGGFDYAKSLVREKGLNPEDVGLVDP